MYKNCIAELVIYLICDFLLLLHVLTIIAVVVIDNIFLNSMCVQQQIGRGVFLLMDFLVIFLT